MTLREAKQILREFIRKEWSDEKLAQVYAFNADGRMDFDNPCCCLVGVSSSTALHTKRCDTHHYGSYKPHAGFFYPEHAYCLLGYLFTANGLQLTNLDDIEAVRQRRFSAMLRAEMRRRDRVNARPLTTVTIAPEVLA